MDYLDLIEEYTSDSPIDEEQQITIFEKVLIIAKRAKDLAQGKTALVGNLGKHNEITKAHYEYVEGMIMPKILEEAPEPIVPEEELEEQQAITDKDGEQIEAKPEEGQAS